MQSKVSLVEGTHLRVDLESGHTISMDAAPEYGGHNLGPRPLEVLLAALGGCAALSVLSTLRKSREQITGYEAVVSGERSAEYPKVFTQIVVHHVVRGRGISEAAVKRALHLAETKLCDVSIMLSATVKISATYEIAQEP
jgi:putative redox protein